MSTLPNCPKCNSAYTYEDVSHLVCPECAHEGDHDIDCKIEGFGAMQLKSPFVKKV